MPARKGRKTTRRSKTIEDGDLAAERTRSKERNREVLETIEERESRIQYIEEPIPEIPLTPELDLGATNQQHTSNRKGYRKVAIDPAQVKLLAAVGCTLPEMAQVLHCSVSTLSERFIATMEAGRLERNASIRRLQFKLAMEGDRTMLVWLGKQWLGQSDQMKLGEDAAAPFGGGGTPKKIEVVFVAANHKDEYADVDPNDHDVSNEVNITPGHKELPIPE
jgi:AraC-like DNA-binding protein